MEWNSATSASRMRGYFQSKLPSYNREQSSGLRMFTWIENGCADMEFLSIEAIKAMH